MTTKRKKVCHRSDSPFAIPKKIPTPTPLVIYGHVYRDLRPHGCSAFGELSRAMVERRQEQAAEVARSRLVKVGIQPSSSFRRRPAYRDVGGRAVSGTKAEESRKAGHSGKWAGGFAGCPRSIIIPTLQECPFLKH